SVESGEEVRDLVDVGGTFAGGPPTRRLRQLPHALDERERRLALEVAQHVAERGGEVVDVTPKRLAFVGARHAGRLPPPPRCSSSPSLASPAACCGPSQRIRLMDVARRPSTSTATAITLAGPCAGRKRRGNLCTKRSCTSSNAMPIDDACTPVMPTSVM